VREEGRGKREEENGRRGEWEKKRMGEEENGEHKGLNHSL
jgi:hypothetical protein